MLLLLRGHSTNPNKGRWKNEAPRLGEKQSWSLGELTLYKGEG
jgi:hypothetical protein